MKPAVACMLLGASPSFVFCQQPSQFEHAQRDASLTNSPRLASTIEDESFTPAQTALPVAAPQGAVLLLGDGTNHAFVSMAGDAIDWLVDAGSLVAKSNSNRSNHICSTVHFRDADIHVEFMLPDDKRANSGIYIHGNYEVQIYNSFGKTQLSQEDMGAIYGFAPPQRNATRKPNLWQVFDIRYRAPRRDENGIIVRKGVITCWLNGQQVQDAVQLGEPRSNWHPFRYGNTPYLDTIYEQQKMTSVGPLFLQEHDHNVRFRNVWIRPLDNRLRNYSPGKRPDKKSASADDKEASQGSKPSLRE